MTGGQRALLAHLNDEIVKDGVRAPSVQAMAARFDRSPTSIFRMLRRLERDGFIRRLGRRNIEVLNSVGRQSLTYGEMAWCQQNPERIRAMMKLLGVIA